MLMLILGSGSIFAAASYLNADTDLEWLLYLWLGITAFFAGMRCGGMRYQKPFSAGLAAGAAGAVFPAAVGMLLYPPLHELWGMVMFFVLFIIIAVSGAVLGSIRYRAKETEKKDKNMSDCQ